MTNANNIPAARNRSGKQSGNRLCPFSPAGGDLQDLQRHRHLLGTRHFSHESLYTTEDLQPKYLLDFSYHQGNWAVPLRDTSSRMCYGIMVKLISADSGNACHSNPYLHDRSGVMSRLPTIACILQ